MQDLVDQMFAPHQSYTSLLASDEFSTFTYWRTPLTPLNGDESITEPVIEDEQAGT